MARFTLPRDIYFGPGAIQELKNLKGHKKAFIVTGGHSMRRTGFLQKLEDVLKGAGLQTRISMRAWSRTPPSSACTTARKRCASSGRM